MPVGAKNCHYGAVLLRSLLRLSGARKRCRRALAEHLVRVRTSAGDAAPLIGATGERAGDDGWEAVTNDTGDNDERAELFVDCYEDDIVISAATVRDELRDGECLDAVAVIPSGEDEDGNIDIAAALTSVGFDTYGVEQRLSAYIAAVCVCWATGRLSAAATLCARAGWACSRTVLDPLS